MWERCQSERGRGAPSPVPDGVRQERITSRREETRIAQGCAGSTLTVVSVTGCAVFRVEGCTPSCVARHRGVFDRGRLEARLLFDGLGCGVDPVPRLLLDGPSASQCDEEIVYAMRDLE